MHSHSYTANPLACTAANASLDLFEKKGIIEKNKSKSKYIKEQLMSMNSHNNVGDIRQTGMINAIEMVKDKHKRIPFDWKERRGIKAYKYALENNVLLRPLGNVMYFMPPYVIKKNEIDHVINVMEGAINIATK